QAARWKPTTPATLPAATSRRASTVPIDPKDIARVTKAAEDEAAVHAARIADLPRQRLVAEVPPAPVERSVPLEIEVETARKLSQRTREDMKRRMRPFAR